MTLLRQATGIVGVALGLWVARAVGRTGPAEGRLPEGSDPEPRRPQDALFEFLRRVGASYLLGLALAAVMETVLLSAASGRFPAVAAALALVTLSAFLGFAPEALLPGLFVLAHKGLGVGGVLAASLTGVVVSNPALCSVTTRAGRLAMGTFMLASIGTPAVAEIIGARLGIAATAARPVPMAWGLLDSGCAALVALLLTVSLVRIGLRAWCGTVFGRRTRGLSTRRDHSHEASDVRRS